MPTDEKNKNDVDILPMSGINNDFAKVYNEFNGNDLNHLTLHKLVTLLEMKKGQHRLLPNLGLKDTLLSIPSTDADILSGKMTLIEEEIKNIINLDVQANYELIGADRSHAEITIEAEHLPTKTLVTVQNYNKSRIAGRISTKFI